MATTKAYEIGQLAGQLDVDSVGDITLTGNLDVSYSGFDSDFAAKTTTNLTEGDNLYYTTARADSDATVAAIAAISVTDAGGDGSLTYSNGAITYTGPSAAETRAHFSAGTGISINSGQISVNSSDNVTFADITTTGVLNGPATFYIDPAPVDSAGGLLVIRGDLQVDGTTTTVNSTTVTINDKNIVLADSAANASEADGAGITVEGANATITYDASNDEWDFNKDINVTGTMFADDAKIISLSPDLELDGDGDGFPTFRIRRINGSTKTNQSYYWRIFSGGDLALVDETNSNTNRLILNPDGDVRFFNSDGSSTSMRWDTSAVSLNFTDNSKATFGSSSDLQIYHDGFNSIINDAGTGSLILKSNGFGIKMLADNDENLIKADVNGAVTLYHDNATRLQTNSTGVDITGATVTDSLTVQGTTRIGSGTSTGDFKIIGNTGPAVSVGGSTLASVISTYGTSGSSFHIGIEVPSNDTNDGFYVATDANQDGVVDTLAMKINAVGNVGIGTNNPLERLHVYHKGNDTYDTIALFQYYDSDDSTLRYETKLGPNGNTFFKSYVTGSSPDFLIVDQDNAADRLAFQVQGNAGSIEGLSVTSSGNVGIGTTDPTGVSPNNSKLAIYDNGNRAGITLATGSTSGVNTIYFADGTTGTSKYRGIIEYQHSPDELNLYASATRVATITTGGIEVNSGSFRTDQVRHSIRPSLLLDFANSKTLDPRITFTRGSTATYWDGKTTTKAEENLVRYSQAISSANGFWNNGSMGTLTVNATTAPDGTSTASSWIPDTDAGSHYFYTNSLPNRSGQEHVHSIYMKANGYNYGWLGSYDNIVGGYTYVVVNLTNGNIETTYTGVNASNVSASVTSLYNGWYRIELTATLGYSYLSAGAVNTASNITGNVPNFTGNGTSGIYIWGAQSEWDRTSATAYIATTSSIIVKYQPALKTASSGVARFDHDPVTGESKGLLIEESRTNLVTYSEDFTQSNWTKGAVTIKTDGAVAPDGSLANTIVETDATNTEHLAYNGNSSPLGVNATIAMSIYLKDGAISGRRYAGIRNNNVSSGAMVVFDLQTGTVVDTNASGNYTINSYNIEDVGNGWYYCSAVFSDGGDGYREFRIQLVNSASPSYNSISSVAYTGDGISSIYAWGAQMEIGSFPTSYIPTTSASATRSADVAKIIDLPNEDWHSNNQGTLFADFGPTYTGQSIGLRVLNIVSSDGTVKYNLEGYRAEMRTTTTWNGINFSNETSAGGKVAITYDTTGFDAASYGLGGYSAVSTVPWYYPDEALNIGSLNSTYVNTTIKKVAYYPQRLSDAELTAMTEE